MMREGLPRNCDLDLRSSDARGRGVGKLVKQVVRRQGVAGKRAAIRRKVPGSSQVRESPQEVADGARDFASGWKCLSKALGSALHITVHERGSLAGRGSRVPGSVRRPGWPTGNSPAARPWAATVADRCAIRRNDTAFYKRRSGTVSPRGRISAGEPPRDVRRDDRGRRRDMLRECCPELAALSSGRQAQEAEVGEAGEAADERCQGLHKWFAGRRAATDRAG